MSQASDGTSAEMATSASIGYAGASQGFSWSDAPQVKTVQPRDETPTPDARRSGRGIEPLAEANGAGAH
jgi:hypothetical protein